MDAPSRSPLAKATAARHQRDWSQKKPQPPRNISPMAARVVGLDTRSPRSASISPKPARLVSSRQRWAHSVCSKKELEAALQDDSITAIETDLIWSTSQSAVVHAHPPQTTSDLAFDAFMDAVTTSPQRKHIKLDFKSADVVQPVVWGLEKYYCKALQARGQHVWLNADVLVGPGSSECGFDADGFVQACVRHRAFSSLSLGWTVDVGLGHSYSVDHVAALRALLQRHKLLGDPRLAISANLRMALRSSGPLRRLLDECRGELLLWTGVGEPPVSEQLVERARRVFPVDRLALDVSSTTAADALAQEAALSIYRAWRRAGALVAKLRARDADADADDDFYDRATRRRPTCCR